MYAPQVLLSLLSYLFAAACAVVAVYAVATGDGWALIWLIPVIGMIVYIGTVFWKLAQGH